MSADDFKQNIVNTFELVAGVYDGPAQRYFVFTADQMVQMANPKFDERVLDIATGTGHAAIAAAHYVGDARRVHAIDLSRNMLAQAKKKCEHLGVFNMDFFEMDAENLDFKNDYYDIILCSFGLFFVNDIVKTLQGWRRVLKPGGRVVFTTFTTNAFKPYVELFANTIESFGITIDGERFGRLNDSDKCCTVLSKAGFSDIKTEVQQLGFHLKDENDWWEIVESSGLRGFIEQLDSDKLAEFKKQHLQKIAEHKTEKGIWLDVEVIFTMGFIPS